MTHNNPKGGTTLIQKMLWALAATLLATSSMAQTSSTITIQAESFVNMSGVDVETTSDTGGGQNVGWIDANDWMNYSVNIPTSGWYKVDYRIASTVGNATLVLSQNAQDISANVVLPNTNGWQNWQTLSSRVYLNAGSQTISIYVRSGGFNINWFALTPEDPCTGAAAISIPGRVEAESFCAMQGVQTENTADVGAGLNVGWTDAGDWMDYKISVASGGVYTLNYRVATTVATAQVAFGNSTAFTLGNTGAWQTWKNFSTQVTLATGTQVIRLNVKQPGFNINWFELQKVVVTSSSDKSSSTSSVKSSSSSSSKSSSSVKSSLSSSIKSSSSSKSSSSVITSSVKSSSSSSVHSSSKSSSSSKVASSSSSSVGVSVTPNFGANVKVFDTTMGDAAIQAEINRIFSVQELNHALFGGESESSVRSAILFKPGSYKVDIPVGFYTQVLGLGASPDDVKINGKLTSEPYLTILHPEWGNNATQNFWRGVENFSTINNLVTWAVSQSTYFRRMHVNGDVHLYEVDSSRPSWNIKSWGSGGWISDSLISGKVDSGLQQQWFTRNSNWTTAWTGDDNNFLVFLGIPSSNIQPASVATNLSVTPLVAEKPSLLFNGSQYEVFVPAVKTNSSGISWASGKGVGTTLPIDQFYIAKESDTAATINTALSQGKHLLLTPGIYSLNDTLRITKANTVVLGLGFASLQPVTGKPAIAIADVDGVRLAGIAINAGTLNSPQLIEVGASGSSLNHSANPTILSDVFVAIGGAMEGQADKALVINSHDVIIDHAWIWRADHGNGVGWDWNQSKMA